MKTETKNNAGRGFTIIELMVSISIVAILTALVMANPGFSSHQKNLERSAQQLALDIRRAENLSLAPSDSPTCYYGLKVNSATDYFVYKNTSCPTGGVPFQYYPAGLTPSTIVDSPSVTFASGISISNYSPVMDVSFEPPEPVTFISGVQNNSNVQGTAGNTVLTITLQSQDGATKNVVVNRFGQVEIQ